ncbi:cytochrome P450 monooxygenase, partial [Aspergillus violaceofuscus CBS 115571]
LLPAHFIDEIKSLPESKASFAKGIFTRFLGQYTTIGTHDQISVNSVKMDLTRNITKSLQGLQEETAFAFPETFGPCEHWTPIPLYAMLLRVVALLSGRVFVGLPLSRNEEWIHATINYTVDTFAAREKIVKYPWLLQPIMATFIPEVQAIKGHLATAGRLLKPILKERLKAMQMPDHQPPEDMIQFIIKNSGTRAGDIGYQASMQMLLSLAAIHTTSMNLTHVIYDLCARPEYLGPLREELGSVLKQDAGILGKSSMPKLRKMDSFLKESKRRNPPSCVSMERIATSKLLLSDGLNIPKGTSLAFCSNGPNMDPSIVDKPEDFNGFRWSQLREKPGNETKYQFVTTGTHSINFGHGTHACPGRFFASNEIKVALAYVIQNYDFEFRNGDSRPANIYRGTAVMPDPTRFVMFRKVRIH